MGAAVGAAGHAGLDEAGGGPARHAPSDGVPGGPARCAGPAEAARRAERHERIGLYAVLAAAAAVTLGWLALLAYGAARVLGG